MSPSPIGTLTLTTSSLDDCYSNKYTMNILSSEENTSNSFNFNSTSDFDSPELSQSPSVYSPQSSLTCSPKKPTNVSKSIDIKSSNGASQTTIQTPTSNDMILGSLNGTSFPMSFDKISNSSFMDYFNIADSYSVSPSINCNFSINNDCIEFKEGNCCLYARSNNSDVITRKKKVSLSSSNNIAGLFSNLDDFDFNFDDSKNNDSENIRFLDQCDNEKTKREKDVHVDDAHELNQMDNHDTLIAIREMAIREKRCHQRKHKNSTSSVSSASMSSRIKKFAIDLQNTTSSMTTDNQDFKPVSIYTTTTTTTTTTPATTGNCSGSGNAAKSSLKIEYLLNNLADHDHDTSAKYANEFDMDRFNIDVDDTDLSQFLELEGWEQMLDEDCISRLTTDFGNQNFVTKKCANESIENAYNLDNNQSTHQHNLGNTQSPKANQHNKTILKTSLNNEANNDFNLKLMPSSSISTQCIKPSTNSSVVNYQHSSHATKKSQPLVVVLSSVNAKATGNSSSPVIEKSSNDTKCVGQFRQIGMHQNATNKALTVTNNQIKKLHINSTETFESQFESEAKPLFKPNQSQLSGQNSDTKNVCLNESSDVNNLSSNTPNKTKIHSDNKDAELMADSDSTSAMSSSLIDPTIEVIDCINPGQIFPYRIAVNNSDVNFSEISSAKNWTQTNAILENNLKAEHLDEEDDEEIDVVSINQNNNNSTNNNIANLSLNKTSTKNNLQFKDNIYNMACSNTSFKEEAATKQPNLNHHNYYHQPSAAITQTNNSNNGSSSNMATNKKIQANIQSKNGSHQKDQSSLLAKCLKSANSVTSDIYSKQDLISNSSANVCTVNKPSSNLKVLGEKKTVFSSLTRTISSNEFDSSSKMSDKSNYLVKNSSFVNNSNSTIASLSKSISSPLLKKSTNLLFNTINLDQSHKNSTISSSSNQIVNTSLNSSATNLSARNLSQKSLTNPIRILTTSINSSNSAIRQINQTTTLCTKPNIIANSSINKAKSSNIIHIPTQQISANSTSLMNNSACNLSNTFTKNCKNSNKSNTESKIVTTTLIAKPQTNQHKITSTNLMKMNEKLKPNADTNCQTIKNESSQINSIDTNSHRLNDFKQNLLFNKSELSGEFDFGLSKFSELKSFEDDFAEDDDENNDLTDESDDEDDDDEFEESCTISCSLQTNSNNLSPLSLTSSGQSNASSGCSTPIKTKVNKIKNNKMLNDLSDKRIGLSEKFRYKKKRKNKQLCLMTGATSTSSKRNSRLNLLGYSNENPAEKRAFHILSERQRRNDLKKLFETLRTNIPNLCDKQKASKLTILKAAVDHLMEVSNKKEKLNVIFDKEKQKNAILIQNLKNLQQSFNGTSNHSISNNNCYSHAKTSSTVATLFVH